MIFWRIHHCIRLLTGQDVIAQLKGKELGEYLLLPVNMFRSGETVFLDDLTAEDAEKALQVKVRIVKSSGRDFVKAVLYPELEAEQTEDEAALEQTTAMRAMSLMSCRTSHISRRNKDK